MSFIVSTSLPLPGSYSGLSADDVKVNNRFRNFLAKRLGVKFKLVGANSFAPYYAVDVEFTYKAEAEGVADNISYEVRHAIAEGRVRYAHPKHASCAILAPASVFDWNQDRPFWG